MSRHCRGLCEEYPRLAPNYKDGKKCCRHCGVFLVSTEPLCPCCKYPLAYKGRANNTQLSRRSQLRLIHADKIAQRLVVPVVRGGVIIE